MSNAHAADDTYIIVLATSYFSRHDDIRLLISLLEAAMSFMTQDAIFASLIYGSCRRARYFAVFARLFLARCALVLANVAFSIRKVSRFACHALGSHATLTLYARRRSRHG